jgi:hypothetical protein
MRGQTALEFMVLLGFMLIIFTTFFYVLKERSSISTQQNRYSELATVSDIVREEVTTANQVKDGYRRVFELPRTVSGSSYRIALDSQNEITITTTDEEYFIFLPTNVSLLPGPVNSGFLSPGKNIIEKQQGKVYITPISAALTATPNPCSLAGAGSCSSTIGWSGAAEGTRLIITTEVAGVEALWQCVVPGTSSLAYTVSQPTLFRIYGASGCTLADRTVLADSIFVFTTP